MSFFKDHFKSALHFCVLVLCCQVHITEGNGQDGGFALFEVCDFGLPVLEKVLNAQGCEIFYCRSSFYFIDFSLSGDFNLFLLLSDALVKGSGEILP